MSKIKLLFMFLIAKIRRLFFMQLPESERDYKVARIFFIIDGALSGAIGPLATGTVIATVLSAMKVSDGLNGIISSWSVLFGITQLVVIPLTSRLKKRKLFVCVLASGARMLQGFMLFVPFMGFLNNSAKIIVFLICYGLSYALAYAFNPPYMEWVNSMIPSKERGGFFGSKTACTIAASSVASFISGAVMDKYVSKGMLQHACYIMGISIIVLSALIFFALAVIKEPHRGVEDEMGREAHGSKVKKVGKHTHILKGESVLSSCKKVFSDKHFRPALILNCMWNVVYYFTFLFMAIYSISDLKLSYLFISTIAVVYGGIQTLLSGRFGRLGDKLGFERLFMYAYCGAGLTFVINIFTVPKNGTVMYAIVYVLMAIVGSAINPCNTAIQMNRAKQGEEGAYVAVVGTVVGILVSLTSFVGGAVVTFFQKKEVVLLGNHIYGQQILSLFSAALSVCCIFYLKRIRAKETKNEEKIELNV